MADDTRRPIKAVFPQDHDYKFPKENARPFPPLCDVDEDYRAKYAGQVQSVRNNFESSLSSGLPVVAKIVLKDKAKAKSFRPSEILNDKTCPIIGVTRAGTLLASATAAGLNHLESRILGAGSKLAESHLSTLEAIEPFTESDALSFELKEQTLAIAARSEGGGSLKVKLFRHGNPQVDSLLDQAFVEYAEQIGVPGLQAVKYGRHLKVFKCPKSSFDVAVRLAQFVGTQSVSNMPTVHLVRTAARTLGPITANSFPPPDPNKDYPVVGQFDSGTDPGNKLLQQYVVGRLDCHPREAQDNFHGTFVGSLLANSRHLNNGDSRFPAASAKIVDVVVFNSSYESEESDLIMFIEDGLKHFPDVKVWNLSLASSEPCSNDEVSDFGATLDDFREQYGVLFVTAAGNIAPPQPMRRWPVEPHYGGQDRLAPPGDGIHGLTVGGLANLDNDRTLAKRDGVSPFSRRGPAIGGIIKPEFGHYSGNCDENGNCIQTGIISVNENGQLAEDIGVSYGTPLVTAIAGAVDQELRVAPDASATLVKAMMVHAAFVQNHPIIPDHVEYTGLGRPPDAVDILSCRESSATVVFQMPVERRPRFYKHPFPMPPCLTKDGILKCEVFMTLLYDPPLERGWGIEYCRRNVTASLGFLETDEETGEEKYRGREIHAAPAKLRNRYPDDMATFGFDWSPLKLYHRKFSKTKAGRKWRLDVRVMNRAECDDERPMPVNLIVTIRSADSSDPVWTEMVREMEAQRWIVRDLELRSRVREEIQG